MFSVQACIDDNLDMVEFLVEHGANINSGDHEGWTPLHATASCGFLSIARYALNSDEECNDVYKMCVLILLLRYLIEHNADVAAVNNDGELPIDIAETEAMEELLDRETQLRGCFNLFQIINKFQNENEPLFCFGCRYRL